MKLATASIEEHTSQLLLNATHVEKYYPKLLYLECSRLRKHGKEKTLVSRVYFNFGQKLIRVLNQKKSNADINQFDTDFVLA